MSNKPERQNELWIGGLGGNYEGRARELALSADAGEWIDLDVLHDTWCAFFHGQRCNCSPVVKVRRCDA